MSKCVRATNRQAGYAAFQRGKLKRDCPSLHKEGVRDWLSGWELAANERRNRKTKSPTHPAHMDVDLVSEVGGAETVYKTDLPTDHPDHPYQDGHEDNSEPKYVISSEIVRILYHKKTGCGVTNSRSEAYHFTLKELMDHVGSFPEYIFGSVIVQLASHGAEKPIRSHSVIIKERGIHYWRAPSQGYTENPAEAHVYSLLEAMRALGEDADGTYYSLLPTNAFEASSDATAADLSVDTHEEGEASCDGAIKYDGGKSPVMQGCVQRFPLALQQIALVSEYGRRKYGTYDGWEKLDDAFNRYNDAMGRHILLRKSEGELDAKDSGLPHLAQVAWNALAILEIALREGVFEMTVGNDIVDGKPVLKDD